MNIKYKKQLVIFGTFGLLFCLGGIVSVGFGISLYRENRAFADKANSTSGEIVDYKKVVHGTGSGDNVTYYVIVEFIAENGHKYRFQGPDRQKEGPFKLRKGDLVNVIYNPAEPQVAKVNSFLGMWFGATILIIVGSGAIIIPPLTLFNAYKWVKKQENSGE